MPNRTDDLLQIPNEENRKGQCVPFSLSPRSAHTKPEPSEGLLLPLPPSPKGNGLDHLYWKWSPFDLAASREKCSYVMIFNESYELFPFPLSAARASDASALIGIQIRAEDTELIGKYSKIIFLYVRENQKRLNNYRRVRWFGRTRWQIVLLWRMRNEEHVIQSDCNSIFISLWPINQPKILIIFLFGSIYLANKWY